MASVASQLIEEVTAHEQSDSLEDAREICADGTYFPNNLRTCNTLHRLKWVKGKTIPVEAWKGPEGSRRFRLSDFLIMRTCKW